MSFVSWLLHVTEYHTHTSPAQFYTVKQVIQMLMLTVHFVEHACIAGTASQCATTGNHGHTVSVAFKAALAPPESNDATELQKSSERSIK